MPAAARQTAQGTSLAREVLPDGVQGLPARLSPRRGGQGHGWPGLAAVAGPDGRQ